MADDPSYPTGPAGELGPDAFRRVVRLARIELSAEEERELAPQLAEIVGWIDELRGWDDGETRDRPGVDGREAEGRAPRAPRADPDDGTAHDPVRRPPGLDRDEALERAPEAADGFFVVPPIRRDE